MKSLLLIPFFTTTFTFAAGYHCDSTCVYFSPSQATFYNLGKVQNSGDVQQSDLFRLMIEECNNRARQSGLPPSQVSLARSIRFQQMKAQNRECYFVRTAYEIAFGHFESSYQNTYVAIEEDQIDQACKPDASIPAGTTPFLPNPAAED